MAPGREKNGAVPQRRPSEVGPLAAPGPLTTPGGPQRGRSGARPWGGAGRRQGRSLHAGAELGGGRREWPGCCGEGGRRSGAWHSGKGAWPGQGLCGRGCWGGAELLGGRRSKGHQLGRGLEAEKDLCGQELVAERLDQHL